MTRILETPEEVFEEIKRIPYKSNRKILEHFCEILGDTKEPRVCVNSKDWEEDEKSSDREEHKWIKVKEKKILTPGEYLVDFCHYNYSIDGTYRVNLAMEVELAPINDYKEREADWDFYKLVDVKAPLKVWISVPECKEEKTERGKREQQLKLLDWVLKKTELRLANEKENYLIVLFPATSDNPKIRAFVGDHEGGLKKDGGWREIGSFCVEDKNEARRRIREYFEEWDDVCDEDLAKDCVISPQVVQEIIDEMKHEGEIKISKGKKIKRYST